MMANDMRLVLLALALLIWGCADEPPALGSATTADTVSIQPIVTWKRLGSWSGRGDGQTTTFFTERHEWRLNWEAKAATGDDESRLTVKAHSGDSGRVLDVPLDAVPPGAGSVRMVQDPRVFYLSIEAGDLEWSLSADERIARTQPLRQR